MTLLQNPGLELALAAHVITDPGEMPSTVVMAGQPWRIAVEWTVGGRNACLLGGTFIVRAYVDALGAQRKEMAGPAVRVPVAAAAAMPAPRAYKATITGSSTIPPDIYRLAVVLGLENEGVPVPFSALADGMLVEVYAAR